MDEDKSEWLDYPIVPGGDQLSGSVEGQVCHCATFFSKPGDGVVLKMSCKDTLSVLLTAVLKHGLIFVVILNSNPNFVRYPVILDEPSSEKIFCLPGDLGEITIRFSMRVDAYWRISITVNRRKA